MELVFPSPGLSGCKITRHRIRFHGASQKWHSMRGSRKRKRMAIQGMIGDGDGYFSYIIVLFLVHGTSTILSKAWSQKISSEL